MNTAKKTTKATFMKSLRTIFLSKKFWLIIICILMIFAVLFVYGFTGNSLITIIVALVSLFGGALIQNAEKDKEKVRRIESFEYLYKTLTEEMKRILNDKSDEKKYFHMLSYTPAFGNISTPELYEDDRKETTYKNLLCQIAKMGDKVSIKIVCYNENKRREYHERWANAIGKDENDKQTKIKKWEKQAKYIIKIIRDAWGDNSVIEVDHMQPVFFLSTDKMLIQYAIRNYSKEMKKSDISGIILRQEDSVNFFNMSFEEYYYKPGKIVELYNNYFRDNLRYINAAHKMKEYLDKYVRERDLKIHKINILLAYGGGKDSTMVLTFLKYVQELFLEESRTPFKLHILVHIHPGMRTKTLQNIHNVFKKLELDKDSNVEIAIVSKGIPIDASQFINNDFNTENISIPLESMNEFKREILLLGHLSKGLGRTTFCYACNIDMIMSIINYTLDKEGKINFVATGDSKHELEIYATWLNEIFGFINNKKIDIKQGNYSAASFFRDFIKLQNYFRNHLGMSNKKTDNSKKIIKYPELLNIHENIEFSISNFMNLLKNGLGFSFHEDSFNFSETDCFYPAIMAFMANLRDGEDCLNHHVEHAFGIMEEKKFPDELINDARFHYNPSISVAKQRNIKRFLLNKIGIDENKLKSLIYSPFLDNGSRLQQFLNENHINLQSTSVINYIKKGNASISNFVAKLINSNKDEEAKIETFLHDWIGLSREDINIIMTNSGKFLKTMEKNDPYVKYINLENGKTIAISIR